MVWLSYYCHPAAGLKQKTHRRLAVGWLNSWNESKPDCRAGQQRVRKQQVQVLIHGGEINVVCPEGQIYLSTHHLMRCAVAVLQKGLLERTASVAPL
jgi:hypothetical protein